MFRLIYLPNNYYQLSLKPVNVTPLPFTTSRRFPRVWFEPSMHFLRLSQDSCYSLRSRRHPFQVTHLAVKSCTDRYVKSLGRSAMFLDNGHKDHLGQF